MNDKNQIRFEKAIDLIKNKNYKNVLDLGCRDKILKKYLNKNIKYQGVDYKDSEYVIGHNLEKDVPFPDNSFDIVFALDVLEHVENIHFLYKEILRVSKKEIIVALPNMYYWKYRFKFLKGKPISDKYIFSPNSILDRHRWITSYDDSLKFIKMNSKNMTIKTSVNFYPYSSKFLQFLDKNLSKMFPNLFVHTMYFHITKD
jgi:SAM-dependent methyltransferase